MAGWEVTLAWHAYQQLRSMHQASTPARFKTHRSSNGGTEAVN
jgi:hypothetical protein